MLHDTSMILRKKVRPDITTLVAWANLAMKRSNSRLDMRAFLSTPKLSSLVPPVFVIGGVVLVWWCSVQFPEMRWLAVVLQLRRGRPGMCKAIWDYSMSWPFLLWEHYRNMTDTLRWRAIHSNASATISSVHTADQMGILCRYIICHSCSQSSVWTGILYKRFLHRLLPGPSLWSADACQWTQIAVNAIICCGTFWTRQIFSLFSRFWDDSDMVNCNLWGTNWPTILPAVLALWHCSCLQAVGSLKLIACCLDMGSIDGLFSSWCNAQSACLDDRKMIGASCL